MTSAKSEDMVVPVVCSYEEFVEASARETAKQWGTLYPAIGLVAEAGEVLEIYQKALRKGRMELTKEEKDKLFDECGDVLWYLTRTLQTLDKDLIELMIYNQAKLEDRFPEGFNA